MKPKKRKNMSPILPLFSAVIVVLVIMFFPQKYQSASRASESKTTKKPNRLIKEKSPYLLQHADNPVDWYPWGEEAFKKAREENKPIFLSIGYSTCHWCHVMEHESFEDPEVAKLMNDVFVSVKVDREERPDIDNVYMNVCHMLTRKGCGWPLTIFMTPDKKPFFAATYIPKGNRFGRTGMIELIPNLKRIWETERDNLLKSADEITSALQQSAQTFDSQGEALGAPTIKLAHNQLEKRFDTENGGFGTAPKFPSPHNLVFLLRYWKRGGNDKALDMVEKTLQKMRNGGIYDHIGFGFHRYSTDPEWLVPHFEKMLYDQAMLAMAYTEAYQATGKEEYKKTAQEIFTYVLRDMAAPGGGFYSAEDADSEGEEGKFYLWTGQEIRKVLGKDDADLIVEVFDIEKGGNFDEAKRKKTGENILHLKNALPQVASQQKMPKKELEKRIESAREKLFSIRKKRIHPHKDDKIITDWNGLMIAALAKGANAFDEPKYAEAARRSADFILKNMRKPDGTLLHRYRGGEAALQSNIDDYAFLTWGLIELYEATFDINYLKSALSLNDDLIKRFWDAQNGGFYFTPDDGEELLVRQKEIYDGAIPSGNSVAMLNLLRLGRITADSDLEDKAAKIGKAFSGQLKRSPAAFTMSTSALDFGLGPSYEVVIAGKSDAKDTEEMLNALSRRFIPNKVVLFRPTEEESPDITRIAEFTKGQTTINGKATAYVCKNYICDLPTNNINKMLELLSVKKLEKGDKS
ncbi:MAG: thioredoxin domain-containing protein [Thermodesulfobacteriota bacterium]